MDTNLTQDQLFLKADQNFDQLKCMIQLQSQQHVRIDLIERSLFEVLLNIGLMLLKALVAGAGTGDEGEQVSTGGRTLRRSEKPHCCRSGSRACRSIATCSPSMRQTSVRRTGPFKFETVASKGQRFVGFDECFGPAHTATRCNHGVKVRC